ncbi:MAG: L-aspartate oxidase [Flavobacteriales bacterium]|nr:L-aspartate oxidase [Flavobacteriales bacterium]
MLATDVVIVGSGIAGLSAALYLAEKNSGKRILILNKSNYKESNSFLAQGGLAIPIGENDNIEFHITDTLNSGAFLNDKKVVEFVSEQSTYALSDLEKWGVEFDREDNGKYHLGLEGAHSRNRIVHSGDKTGEAIIKSLIRKTLDFPNITLLENCFVIDLILSGDKKSCLGLIFLDNETEQKIPVYSAYTILAGGGVGQVYSRTTNPIVATGDTIAMAHRAGAVIKGMEFIQFHPTVFYSPNHLNTFLITEALRGYGAYLVNAKGKRFLFETDVRGELASRDVISIAIQAELLKTSEEFVFLDCRHLDKNELARRFSGFLKNCQERNLDPIYDLIPIAPAAHYCCGGIETTTDGQSNIKNLFALGECAYTGLHGANRLASNSLPEAQVFAKKCADFISSQGFPPRVYSVKLPNSNARIHKKFSPIIENLRNELKHIMDRMSGAIRSEEGLRTALKKIELINHEFKAYFGQSSPTVYQYELRNMIDVAFLIIHSSILRKNSIGCFFKI